jgi:CBS domain-containing protein
MQVEELMTKDVRACGPDDSLHRAAQTMWEGDLGAVPVVDAGGRVIGIITDRDICMAAYLRGGPLTAHRVGDVMARNVHVCGADDSVDDALAIMRKHQVRRLPVVRGEQLVGILSLNDAAIAAGAGKLAKKRGLGAEAVAATLARVCEHRGADVAA